MGNQVLDEPEAVHARHRVPYPSLESTVSSRFAGRDIGRVDVNLGYRPGAKMLGIKGGEARARMFDLVGVCDVPSEAVNHPRDERLGELERRHNRRPVPVAVSIDTSSISGSLMISSSYTQLGRTKTI